MLSNDNSKLIKFQTYQTTMARTNTTGPRGVSTHCRKEMARRAAKRILPPRQLCIASNPERLERLRRFFTVTKKTSTKLCIASHPEQLHPAKKTSAVTEDDGTKIIKTVSRIPKKAPRHDEIMLGLIKTYLRLCREADITPTYHNITSLNDVKVKICVIKDIINR